MIGEAVFFDGDFSLIGEACFFDGDFFLIGEAVFFDGDFLFVFTFILDLLFFFLTAWRHILSNL